MRLLPLATAVLLLAGPVLAQGSDGSFEIQIERTRIEAFPGESSETVAVTATRACPVSGTIDFEVVGPPEVNVTAVDVAWRTCGRSGAVLTYSAVVVTAPEGTPAGVYEYTLTAASNGETAEAPFEVVLPYDAKVALAGPRSTDATAGAALAQTFNVSVAANAPTRLALAAAAPEGWRVQTVDAIDVPASARAVRKTWTVTVTPPPEATGDHKIALSAAPSSAAGDATDDAATWDWYVRLPRPIPVGTTDASAGGTDDGTPAWVVGAALVGGAVVALWWSRR